MTKSPYSNNPCACGCGKPAKARGVYHSEACCQRIYRERHAERVAFVNRRYYCKRAGLPVPEDPKQVEMFPSKKQDACTCRDYAHCTRCRNQERRQAEKEDRMPAYLVGKIAPDVYQICAAIAAEG